MKGQFSSKISEPKSRKICTLEYLIKTGEIFFVQFRDLTLVRGYITRNAED